MASTVARGWFAALLFLVLTLLAPAAQAQAPNTAAVESWLDGLLAEMRTAGATRAERGAVTADGAGGFSVAGLTIGLPNAVQITVTRLTGEGVATGARFQARKLRVEGFALVGDNAIRVEAPAMELETLDMPSLTPAALFGRGDAGLVATIRELNLARWSLPTVTVTGGQNGRTVQATLGNVVTEGVQRGVAQRMAYGPIQFTVTGPNEPTVSGRFGTITAEGINLALNASLFSPPAGASRDLQQAYARAVFEGGEVDLGGGSKITLGRIEATNARMRAPRTGYLEFLRFTMSMPAGPNPDPEALRRMATFMQDYLDLSELERLTIGETSVETPQGNFSIGSFEGRDIASARFGRLAMTDFEFEANDTSLSIGTLALTDVDYTDAFRVLLQGMAQGQQIPNPADFEGRLPRIGSIELRDVSMEAQSQEISLDQVTFAMGRWRGFVPDLLRLTVGELSVPSALIEAGGTLQRPTPTDLGYESIELGGDIQIRIDEQARTARLSPGRIALDEFGAVSVELTLGDVDTSRFGMAGMTDPMPLLQQTTVRELRLRIENTGIFDAYAEWAQQNGRGTAAQLRQQLQQGLAPIVELFVQDPAQKERARAAVQAFGRDPRSLTLVVTPRGRMTLLDIVAATQGGGPPLQLLGQVNLELTAND